MIKPKAALYSILCLLLAFSSCDDDSEKSSFLGTWKMIEFAYANCDNEAHNEIFEITCDEYCDQITFTSGSDVELKLYGDDWVWTLKGTYTTDKNEITFNLSDDLEDNYTLTGEYALSKNILELDYGVFDGCNEVETYKRQQ